ncbi:VWA domain-containing protein [Palleronia abyssalis]|uniref:Magnesium-chelatase 60 kDa subunit n=1 Tax=Palleronia abyssalis TaxID=1501240 RepID=A0A2R8BSK4_9RHOB|nr:VWA domain-containing protein [Palleronia abyssalis]SPJ23121.1 Magnesium-chelatase 60 kDa subunit [Palleronia abyssalis]
MTWDSASLAARVLHVAGQDLGGMWLRARPSPARDTLLAALPSGIRVHPAISDEALLGGPDIAATLAAGRLVTRPGLLETHAVLTLSMADRCTPGLAARLGRALDAGGKTLIAVDEGEDDATPPTALTERLGLFVTLDGVCLSDLSPISPVDEKVHDLYAKAILPDPVRDAIVAASVGLGIVSFRGPLAACCCARAIAAVDGRDCVTEADAAAACQLTLAHRATTLPEDEAPENQPPPDPPPDQQSQDSGTEGTERLVEATRMALPRGLLASLVAARSKGATQGTAGARKMGGPRGRPLPPRPGRPSAGRIDLFATLRATAPWQTIRRASHHNDPRPVLIEPADLHLKRHDTRTERLIIFVVDASGSSAMARMSEAKGAIESLLSQAYASRDHVALISFKGDGAAVTVPPTRSLVQAKRRLAGLTGGGGTPLAAALVEASHLTEAARRKGQTPTLVLLTDGRANIALDKTANRARAAADAEQVARKLRQAGVPTLVINTGTRPSPTLRPLASLLGGTYLALPYGAQDRLRAELT